MQIEEKPRLEGQVPQANSAIRSEQLEPDLDLLWPEALTSQPDRKAVGNLEGPDRRTQGAINLETGERTIG